MAEITPEPIQKKAGSYVAFWITLARAALAVALGLALILHPDKTRPMLVNFIGMFWVAAGAMNLRWSIAGERARSSSILAGVIGVLAGLLVLRRFLIANVVHETLLVLTLGGVIVLTGLVHIFEGFLVSNGDGEQRPQRRRSWSSMLLGVLEMVLGTTVLVWQKDFGPVFYAVATIWAFLGAFVLLREAWVKRTALRTNRLRPGG